MKPNARRASKSISLYSEYDCALVIQPCLPKFDGIFDLRANTLIAAHSPHERIKEHLHDHVPHMHIRYGFEIPQQPLVGIDDAALAVVMMIKEQHRVDCNPVFVARGKGSEGVCLQVGGEDIHWLHDEATSRRGTELYELTGRRVKDGYYFAGFCTSDARERKPRRYSRDELLRMIAAGLRADQHFQATWREPQLEAIEPYEVVIGLFDDTTTFHTFFELAPTVKLGAS